MSRRAPSGRFGGLADLAESLAPARQRLVDRLDPGEQVGAIGVRGQRSTVDEVVGADLHRVEAVEHVELRERQFGEAVEANGLAQHDAVEPAGTTPTTRDGAELTADLDEAVAVVVGELGRKRSGADAGGVGLRDADDAVDVAGPEAGSGACTAGRRVGRRDVRIGAVVEVEERRLGAFEQHVGPGRQGVVQQAHGVGDVRARVGRRAR